MAQLVAHHTGSVGVTGSNPVSSTTKNPCTAPTGQGFCRSGSRCNGRGLVAYSWLSVCGFRRRCRSPQTSWVGDRRRAGLWMWHYLPKSFRRLRRCRCLSGPRGNSKFGPRCLRSRGESTCGAEPSMTSPESCQRSLACSTRRAIVVALDRWMLSVGFSECVGDVFWLAIAAL